MCMRRKIFAWFGFDEAGLSVLGSRHKNSEFTVTNAMSEPPWGLTDAAAMKALAPVQHVPKETAVIRGKSSMPWQPMSARSEDAAKRQLVQFEHRECIAQILNRSSSITSSASQSYCQMATAAKTKPAEPVPWAPTDPKITKTLPAPVHVIKETALLKNQSQILTNEPPPSARPVC